MSDKIYTDSLRTFSLSGYAFWQEHRMRLHARQKHMVARRRDHDAFSPHGSAYALDRWADDGGRV